MDKERVRQIFKKRLISKSKALNIIYTDSLLQKKLEKNINNSIKSIYRNNRNIGILMYFPMNTEFNCVKLLNKLRKKRNISIFLPFVGDTSMKMVKYRLPLIKQSFGFYQPTDSKIYNNKIDIAIVPVLGIDTDFRRIGFGKGMYDRFFEKLKNKPISIFISRTLNYCNQKITSDYDIQTNIYITSTKIIKGRTI